MSFGSRITAAAKALFGNEQSACSSTTDIRAPYSGARLTKLNNHWRPDHYSGDRAIRESWSLLTARIRDLTRNDPVLTKCKQTLCRLVIGTGLNPFSAANDLYNADDSISEFELESDTWFERWCLDEADAQGEHSFWEMQKIAFEEEVVGGQVLWLRVMDSTPGRTVPLCYQLIEWEQVDMTKDRDAELSRSGKGRRYNKIQNGIEYDSRNRKVAYHLYDSHPYDRGLFTTESSRIPADRVIHQYFPHRPSARVGVTWFAPLTQHNKDFDRFVANDLTTRAIQALMGVAVFTDDADRSMGLSDEDPETGLPGFKLGYPQISKLASKDKVEVVESKRSTSDNAPLQNLLLNLHAMGCNISLNRLLGDPSRANLASIKAAHQDDDANAAPIQNNIARKMVVKVRREHTRLGFANGLFRSVSADQYRRQMWRFNTFETVASNRADLDRDDGEASIDRMRSGLSPYQDECARRGRHWRRNLMKMRAVNDEAKRLGVVLDWTKGQGQNPDSSTSIAGDEQQQGATANAN